MPDIDTELQIAMEKNAKAMKVWFAQNHWPQKITDDWAKQGSSKRGPWASQVCELMKGVFFPRPAFFVAMAEFNAAVANQKFPAVKERKILDRLKGAEAMRHNDGTVFNAADFFSMFVGHLEVPEKYQTPIPVTDQVAAQQSSSCVSLFDKYILEEMRTRKEAWGDLTKLLPGWKPQQIKQLQKVLIGEHTWTGEEVTELQNDHGDQPAIKAIKFLAKR